ncbi:MAG: MBOAT family O-acyltransferase [Bacteroidota bacterium]
MNIINEFLNALVYSPKSPLVFNSVLFIVLFSFLYIGYVFVYNDIKKRNLLLLAFSLFFYYKISGFYLILLILMASSDYLIGKKMFRVSTQQKKKLLLLLSIFINIGALILFKYTNFLLNTFFGITTGQPSPVILNLIMPIGISFFVFKTLSYIFDIYREVIDKPEKNYFNYLLYVSFFPNILAGPISKARDLLPQFQSKLNFTRELIGKAFLLILIGTFKKVFIADFLGANLVDRVFDSPEFFTGFEGLMAIYGYAIQIYFDFSGYTDIVIGLAMLLGFAVSPNFNKPFMANNVADFWRRWHMTLSGWFNEYVFYPLSFTFRRFKQAGVVLAVLITFFISGFWHGPNWTYILWGTSHGLAIALTFVTVNTRSKLSKSKLSGLYRFLSIFVTFHFLAFSMVLFRAESLQAAAKVYSLVFSHFTLSVAGQWAQLYTRPLVIMVVAFFLIYSPMKWNDIFTRRFVALHWALKTLVVAVGVIFIYQAFSADTQPFIYLEF